jgi:hypothetical protein
MHSTIVVDVLRAISEKADRVVCCCGAAATTNNRSTFLRIALVDPELENWLAANPDAARELEIARRVRALMLDLRAAAITTPEGFEERLIEQIRNDVTLLQLLDVGLAGFGQAFLALIEMLFGLFPEPQSAPA